MLQQGLLVGPAVQAFGVGQQPIQIEDDGGNHSSYNAPRIFYVIFALFSRGPAGPDHKKARLFRAGPLLDLLVAGGLGRLTLLRTKTFVAGADQSFQLLLLLRAEHGAAVFERFHAQIAQFAAVFFRFVDLRFDLDQIRR